MGSAENYKNNMPALKLIQQVIRMLLLIAGRSK